MDLYIHSSHRRELREVSVWLALMAGGLLALMVVDIPASWRGYAGYPPLHTSLEMFSVCVAGLVFAAGWAAGDGRRILGMVVLACAFAGVAILDMSHALSYAGMPDYVTPADPEKAINFWLAARTVAALALLLSVCLPWQAHASGATRYLALAAVLLVTALVHWLFLYHAEWVPRTFIAGQGLTDFKRAFEYLLIGLNVLAAGGVWLRMRSPQELAVAPLFAALVTMAMSEYLFTLYAEVSDAFNIAGHIYKVIAYGFLYRAIFVAVVRRPYAALHKTKDELKAILDHMADGVITTDASGTVLSMNQAACTMFGYPPGEVLGRSVARLAPEATPEQDMNPVGWHPWRRPVQIPQVPQDVQGHRRDGSTFPIHLTITGTLVRDQPRCISLVRDLTQQRMDEQEIRRLAFYDGLTGLANRRLMRDHLQHAHAASKRTGQYGALMFLDLDHFQHINDSWGLDVGDALLQSVTQRLQTLVREDDTLARIDGDSFAVVAENLGSHRWEAVDRLTHIATRMLEAIATQPYGVGGGKSVHASASIGIVLIAQDDKLLDDLLKEADIALHQAKSAGRNIFCFFDPETQAAAMARAQLEQAMRAGLGRGEFELHYQPQVNRQQQWIGVEALLRWNHPQRGRVSPAEFIPLAEETGLIVPLGQWVLETACAQMVAWSQHPVLRVCTMGVNVSAAQFAREDFEAHVLQTLEQSGANPALLKLELTESILVSNVDAVTRKMRALQARGVQFSLDDFGTGYSSLAYLKRLPLAQLKIDQSFVRDLLTDPNDATIAHTVVALGHSLGLHVIAEGVETEAHRDALLGMGCDALQGFLCGRPQAPDVLEHGLLTASMAPDVR